MAADFDWLVAGLLGLASALPVLAAIASVLVTSFSLGSVQQLMASTSPES
jgi:hypothetical protein